MSNKFNPFSDPRASDTISIHAMKPEIAKLLEYLQQGKSINFFHARDLGISHLDRRIAELTATIKIYSRQVRINNVICLEYSLQPFD